MLAPVKLVVFGCWEGNRDVVVNQFEMFRLQFVKTRKTAESVILYQGAKCGSHFDRIGEPNGVVNREDSGDNGGEILRM